MNITAKYNLPFNADWPLLTNIVNFDLILKSQICDLSYNFGLWRVNKKSEEFVTLHSDFLEMPYELNIKIKCVAPLLLGDAKNLLIPPRKGTIGRSKLDLRLPLYTCDMQALGLCVRGGRTGGPGSKPPMGGPRGSGGLAVGFCMFSVSQNYPLKSTIIIINGQFPTILTPRPDQLAGASIRSWLWE